MVFAVMLQMISIKACVVEEQLCNPVNPDCCEGLVCLEVSPGVHQCEPVGCEDHEGHSCEPGVRKCCDPLSCVIVGPASYECHFVWRVVGVLQL